MAEFRVTAPRDTSAMGALYGVDVQAPPPAQPFPAANSVDWLQQRLPKALGDWLGNAYAEGEQRAGDLSPRTVAGEAITGAMNLVPMGRMAVPRQGIRAYHGSPYDFDRFDISKIGTGEGAQAYGHGLYFAENPATAKSYRDQLAHQNINVGGSSLFADKPWMTPQSKFAGTSALERVQSEGLIGDEAVMAAAKSLHEQMQLTKSATARQGYQDAVNALYDLRGKPWEAGKGKMYEVNINASPEQFLDWDRPLGQQGRVVNSVSPLLERYASPEARTLIDQRGTGSITGEEAHNAIAHRGASGIFARRDPVSASEALRDAGIPGIRYLDQGSRLTGSGNVERLVESHGSREKAMEFAQSQLGKFAPDRPTHKYWTDIAQELQDYKPRTSNYVLFNDSIIDILKKWGLMGGMAGAGAASQDQSSQ